MNIATWLVRTARRAPETPAIFEGMDCVANYRQFDQKAECFAHWLSAQGVIAGERVAVFMENAPDYLMVQYGAWYLGAAVVPINAKLHAKEASWIIQNSGARLTLTTEPKRAALQAVDATGAYFDVRLIQLKTDKRVDCTHRQPDDLAWLFYTSGTTGQPKGVMITHRILQSMSLSYLADVDRVDAQDSALYAAPMSHGAGLYNFVHVLKGARHVFPKSRKFEPLEIFDLAEHFGSVHMFAAPTMVKRLTETAKAHAKCGNGLRTIVYAGGPMYEADILEASAQFGDVFVQIYGQGECPMGITALPRGDVADRDHPNWRARLGSVGCAQSAVEVQISDETGENLGVGVVGEIQVRGDTVMLGYWRNEEASAKTIVKGWLKTGDLGTIDADGYVTLVDRSKDVIISGGSNIYPREVEEVLLKHNDVVEVSVIGARHAEWGEEVIAFVVLSAECDLDTQALDVHCLDHIARFKRPKQYVKVDALAKNSYGKVLKTALREQLK